MAKKVGPNRSSKPACPLIRIDLALQWYVVKAYIMVSMATPVKRKAEMKATRSPKLSMPMARALRMTVKLSHDRKVRSLAKKTLGSTRVGRAMRLPEDCELTAEAERPGRVAYLERSAGEAEKTWWQVSVVCRLASTAR